MPRTPRPKVQVYEKANGTTSYRVRLRVNGRQTTEAFALHVADPNIGPIGAINMRNRLDPGQ